MGCQPGEGTEFGTQGHAGQCLPPASFRCRYPIGCAGVTHSGHRGTTDYMELPRKREENPPTAWHTLACFGITLAIMDNMHHEGRELYEARRRQGLSQLEVAQLLGIGLRTLARYESLPELPPRMDPNVRDAINEFIRRAGQEVPLPPRINEATVQELVSELYERFGTQRGNSLGLPREGREDFDVPEPPVPCG